MDGTQDTETGELVHDDLLVSAALCWVLDGQVWGLAESEVIEGAISERAMATRGQVGVLRDSEA